MTKRGIKSAKTGQAEERLLAYLGVGVRGHALSEEEAKQLRAGIQTAELSDALWSLGARLFAEDLHHACQARLPDYVRLEASGRDAGAAYPRVLQHLAECVRCAEARDALLQTASATPSGARLPLARATAPSEPGVWERVAAAREGALRLFTEIGVTVRRGLASFNELPNPLSPAIVALPAMRGARNKFSDAGTRVQVLPLVSPDHDVAISLTIGPVSDDHASLIVQVMRSAVEQPLAGVRVTLRDEARRLLASERTQADGRTVFPRIGPGRYVVEVKQADHIWEVPVAFTWQD
jgi:hypothetical protein